MAGGLYGERQLSGGARRDGERPVARVYALGRDRLALRLRQVGEAQLAHAPVARQLVQQLAGERYTPATRARVILAAVSAGRLHAEDAAEVAWHGPELRVSTGYPCTCVVHPSRWAANCG